MYLKIKKQIESSFVAGYQVYQMIKKQIESSSVAGHTQKKLQGVQNHPKHHIKTTIYPV